MRVSVGVEIALLRTPLRSCVQYTRDRLSRIFATQLPVVVQLPVLELKIGPAKVGPTGPLPPGLLGLFLLTENEHGLIRINRCVVRVLALVL